MSKSASTSLPASSTALLVIDMVSCWDFPDADKLLPHALLIAPRIAALKSRCKRDGVPVIYANDNRGRWQSDFAHLVEMSIGAADDGARITQCLHPGEDDYFVLKPKQSAFFATPLDLLLRHLGVHRVIVTGVASDQCVLTTAAEARMRDLDVIVPRDCIASQTRQRNDAVLLQLEEAHKLPTTSSARIRLQHGAPRHASRASTTQEPGKDVKSKAS